MLRGIYQLPSDNFQVKIGFEGRRFNLGTYPTERKAAEAAKFFKETAEGRSPEGQKEVAERMRIGAANALKTNPTDKTRATTMRQDVQTCKERIAELEEQIRMVRTMVSRGDNQ